MMTSNSMAASSMRLGWAPATRSGDRSSPARAAVVPPSLDRLPAPGEAPDAPQIAGIQDPDAAKQQSRAQLETSRPRTARRIIAMRGCAARKSPMVEGPLGPCRDSVLSAIKKWNETTTSEAQ